MFDKDLLLDSTLSVMQMLGLVVFLGGPFLLYYFQKEIILIYLDLFKNNIKCHTISKWWQLDSQYYQCLLYMKKFPLNLLWWKAMNNG